MNDLVAVVLMLAALFGPPLVLRLLVVGAAARAAKEPWLRRSLLRAPLHRGFYRFAVRVPSYPVDPYNLSVPVEILPFGDGRPGERMWLPCRPATRQRDLGPDGSRADVTVQVAPDLRFTVVCLGRIGWEYHGHVLTAAHERVLPQPGGPVAWEPPFYEATTPIGPAWRRTVLLPGGRRLTDVHLDHDGWAYVIGVLHAPTRQDAEWFRDVILRTWTWIDAGTGRT
ncbi:MAG: hypothetical protein KJ792_16015 [Actinobacteria bacterium]|nr:hypothetical protein [Actinomycetota bacterium]